MSREKVKRLTFEAFGFKVGYSKRQIVRLAKLGLVSPRQIGNGRKFFLDQDVEDFLNWKAKQQETVSR